MLFFTPENGTILLELFGISIFLGLCTMMSCCNVTGLKKYEEGKRKKMKEYENETEVHEVVVNAKR